MSDTNCFLNEHLNQPIPQEFINYHKQTINVNVHHFYIFGEIENDIKKYSELLNILKTSSENDTVILYVNSEGGVLRTTMQIINAMMASNAHIITSLEGEACSAATLIFLAGDEYIINPNCTFMIHNYSGGMWGKGNELSARVKYQEKWFRNIAKTFYTDILSDEEIENVLSGQDMYMDSNELMKRLEAKSKKIKDKIDESEVKSEISKKVSKKTAKKKTSKKKTSK